MATVTGVTQETGVTMEIASQRAIFETSEEERAPSLIADARCVSVSRVTRQPSSVFMFNAVHFTRRHQVNLIDSRALGLYRL